MTSNSDDDKSNNSTAAMPLTQALFPFPSFTPRQFLLLTTIPLSLGTYIGYKRALKQVATDKRTVATERAVAQAPFLAAEPSCVSVAGVGLLCTGIMHLAGVDSVEGLMDEFRRVGRTYAAPMLDSMRIDNEKSRKAQKDLERDRQIVQEMSEDEEIEFWKNKYFGDDGKADDEASSS
eukprot:CAMPEP_0116004712 /NCGR_PEP_ID=MMETSP0321-20121206/757_1 /TAXON_ID=163516 /ORGANISM="Leptocylindrus danicus var. danicus, Strain B650" /LENGTH=177 /DNA_ID=CAMNT_0003473049 /DNA_START=214 /DNA_END=748 /DNA_ORIENTATION=-